MKPSISPALFRPTTKLVGYTLIVGVAGALAALLFDAMVETAQHFLLEGIGGYSPPRVGVDTAPTPAPGWPARLRIPLVTTLGGLLSGWLVYRFAPEAEGHGTDAAIGAYHRRGGEIRSRIPPIKALASALTIGSGGVAGREGPTAQISVGVGTLLANLGGLRGQERRNLLLAGMAAGLAAMFRAPLGMAIFSVEILYSGMVFESEALIYTVIAAVTAYAFYGAFTGWESLFQIPTSLEFTDPPALLGFALLGILAGLLGAVLPTVLYRIRDLFQRLPGPPHIRPAIGGLVVGLVALAAPEILGTGYGWVDLAMADKLSIATVLALLVLKAPAMAITIGSGGSGGVFAPTVTLGAMLGAAVGLGLDALAPVLGVDHLGMPVAAFVVVGMAAVFSGAARTPISTLIMVAEMTGGYGLIVPAMLANILAFMVQRSLTQGRRYQTLYESQVATREDSPTHRGVFVRRAMEMLETEGLHPEEVRLPRLVSLLRFGEAVPLTEDGGLLISVKVEPGSELHGRTVAETLGKVDGATAVAVFRQEELLSPRGDTLFEPGDQLLAVTTRETRPIVTRQASGAGVPPAESDA